MSWTPDLPSLEQLKHIFRGTISSNNQERRAANDALIEAKTQPGIENYLLYILVEDNSTKSDTRAAAGVNLKNIISKSDFNQSSREYLLNNIWKGLLVEETLVKNITGNVITTLFSQYGISGWPQALPQLFELAEQQSGDQNYKSQEAAMSALSKICEDSFMTLDQEHNGEHPLNFLIPKLLVLMSHPQSHKIRAYAIGCINFFIPLKNQSLLVHLDQFLTSLFALAHDVDPEVRKNICASFSLILETRPDKLMPHLDGVVEYCLHLLQDQEGEVALEACDFLLTLASSVESESEKRILTSKLSIMLPILLEKTVYSDEEVFLLQVADEKDQSHVADRDEDIAPQFAKSKDSHQTSSKLTSSSGSKGQHDSDSEFDEEDEDDDDDDDISDQWTVRKSAAATIDMLSVKIAGEVLHVILPLLQERIVSESWPIREAAILTFGAINKSCIELAGDKLPELIPFLVERLQDPETGVRQITCWTVSRYTTWVAAEAHEGGQYANYFQPTFQAIVTCAMDNKKLVQEAACSALSSFIEESDASLLEFYIGPLLSHFASCFKVYQRKNMIVLYDSVQTFVDKMGYEYLAKPEFIDLLLPPLLEKWQQLEDDDQEMWALLECMSSVAISLGKAFAPYAVPVYERAIKILANCIQLDQACHTNPNIDTPEKDFMVTSLDLIDGLIQGFADDSVDLIHQNGVDLMELVLLCFEDYNVDVRQSAYALLGDMAIFTLDQLLKPSLHAIFISIGNEINNRSFSSFPVTNNAIWALGEIAARLNYQEMKPHMSNLVDLLIPLITSTDTQRTLLENCAITLGRMGINGGAEVLSPKLSQFILPWCNQMIYLVENDEKETGFLGMIKIIHGNPDEGFGGLSNQQGRKNLATFISCIGTYAEPGQELKSLFEQLLREYKSLMGAAWQSQILALVDQETRESLQQVYQV